MTSDTDNSRLSKNERKARTLEKISVTFARHGFSGTTTADLAESADISEAMLYKLFGSKEQLYQELIEHKIQEIHEQRDLPEQAAEQGKDREVFSRIGLDVLTNMQEDPTLLRLLLFSGLENNEISELFFEEHDQCTVEFLAKYIKKQRNEDHFRDVDPELIAISFLGMISKLVLSREIFNEPAAEHLEDREIIEQLVDLILNGLKRS